jgi:hypothetical protein
VAARLGGFCKTATLTYFPCLRISMRASPGCSGRSCQLAKAQGRGVIRRLMGDMRRAGVRLFHATGLRADTGNAAKRWERPA